MFDAAAFLHGTKISAFLSLPLHQCSVATIELKIRFRALRFLRTGVQFAKGGLGLLRLANSQRPDIGVIGELVAIAGDA